MSDPQANLPSLRDATHIQLSEGLPGQQLLGLLDYLNEEMGAAVVLMVDEAREQMENADPSRRIALLNGLNARRCALQGHLRQEVREIQTILNGIRTREDPAVLESLEKRIRQITLDITARLEAAMDEFEV